MTHVKSWLVALVFGICTAGFIPLVVANEPEVISVNIDLDHKVQKIRGFGASDAWSVNEVGESWPDQQKQQAAEWLFSQQMDEQGNPKGIGLSMWRFNIGAGSAEQGEASAISNPLRRVESFLNKDGSYDWNKQAGQQWFLQQAKAYGVESLVAFANSPPVQMTRNGLGHGSGGYLSNLQADQYQNYAEFLAHVLDHFSQKGIEFEYVSPVNEPQYQWESNKQEGSPWTNEEIARLIKQLNAQLTDKQLNTKIMLPEAAEYHYLSADSTKRSNPLHNNQIEAFFNPDSDHYLGDLAHVPKMVAGHSYWTVYRNDQIETTRRLLQEKAQEYGLEFFQSEYCLLGLERIIDDMPQDEWDIALFMAKIIHADLAIANASSWSFWTSLSRTNANAKNRYLLIEKQLAPGSEIDKAQVLSRQVLSSKTLWVLGNYSLFLRPGFQRVMTSLKGDLSGLMGSAYLSEDGKSLVTVYVNMQDTARALKHHVVSQANSYELHDRLIYITDRSRQLMLAPQQGEMITIPPSSVVTVVEKLIFPNSVSKASH